MPELKSTLSEGGHEAGTGQGDKAYEGLLDLLVSQEIAAGDVVAERRLAVRLGVSRTPIREALHRLEGERILERRSDGKLYVRRLTIEDVMEVLQVRRLLEADAAEKAAGRIPIEMLDNLRARLIALRDGNDPTVAEHSATDDDLHGMIARYAGSALMAALISDLRTSTRMFSMKRMPERFAPICAEHLSIVDALAAGDGPAAADRMRAHLDGVRTSIISRLGEI